MPDQIADTLLDTADRLLPWAVPLLLALAFALGGPTLDVTATDEWLQLAALPVLLLAAIALSLDPPRARLTRAGIVVALVLAAVPLLQLLPLPQALWSMPPARAALVADLATAGVAVPARWSLHPEATMRSVLALLPALACFLGVVALGPARLRRLPVIVLGLVLANIGFGLLQVGLPEHSPLRLYDDPGNAFGGVLVNINHQGTALVIGMVVALGLWARARLRARNDQPMRVVDRAWPLAAAVCLAAIPLTGSRAAMIIALLAGAAAAAATGLLALHRLGRSRRAAVGALLGAGLLVLGSVSAWRWMQVDALEETRQAMARETVAMGHLHAPLGSGIGSFVNVFAQHASPAFHAGEYVNHAHNEYAQWWLTGGVPALVALLLALAVLAWAGKAAVLRGRANPLAAACWVAVLAVLAHSVVDFPLRSTSLMALTATLAALAIVLGAAALRESRSPDPPAP